MMTVANKDPNTGQRTQGHALAPYAVFTLEGSDDKYIAAYDPTRQDLRPLCTSIPRPTPRPTRRVR